MPWVLEVTKLYVFAAAIIVFFNRYDSYPSHLGASIVDDIPTDPAKYAAWLEEQRSRALEWDKAVEDALCVSRRDTGDETVFLSGSKDFEDRWWFEIMEVDKRHLPDYMPPFNELFIQWIYTLDLDNEIFTVDNGAHFRLDRIARIHWADLLTIDEYGCRIVVPNLVQDESIASLDICLPTPDQTLVDI